MRDSEHELLERQAETLATRLDALRSRHATHERTLIQGEQGEPGPMGPMPRHRWEGTALQFEQGPDGEEWGELVELKGEKGDDGVTRVVSGGGGGPIIVNGYWPQGW